ncbi:hypothetical protein ACFQ3B_10585 [Stackebrandtia endophytica]|uniref:hypothetical protein n=1 Tax=Stackebrandtia endophytica TaxID=1496996 RepID=UPI00114E4575|nr:hypothetical protein [Stackebrandtia endophytica]
MGVLQARALCPGEIESEAVFLAGAERLVLVSVAVVVTALAGHDGVLECLLDVVHDITMTSNGVARKPDQARRWIVTIL